MCQKLEATEMLFCRYLDKQTMVHPHSGVLLNHKRKWALRPRKHMEEPEMHLSKWRQSSMLPYCMRPALVKAQLQGEQKGQGLPVVGGREGWICAAQAVFMVVTLLCMRLWWWTCVIIDLSKPIKWTIQSMNPTVNCGLWLMISFVRSILVHQL